MADDTIKDILAKDLDVDTIERIKDGMYVVYLYGGKRWLVQTERLD